MTKDEALKLALEALELHGKQYPHMVKGYCIDAITAIKAALEAKDEPVGTVKELFTQAAWERLDLKGSTEVYTAPPQRTWVGLTDEEVKKIVGLDRYTDLLKEVVQYVEAKLRSKNNG